MELHFNNLKLGALAFPKRKLRNKSAENWSNSGEQRVFLDEVSTSLDGSTGDVITKRKVPDYLMQAVRDGEVDTAGIFYPTETDPEIEEMLDISAQQKLGGKRWQDATPIELLEAGLIHFH